MNQENRNQEQPAGRESDSSSRRYSTPSLVVYGSIREFTATGSAAQAENPGMPTGMA